MPYDITKYEPGYGGLINSAGNVINQADGITATGARLSANDVVAVTMQSAATATGVGLALNTSNSSLAVLDVQGTFVGTITIKATIDGTTYFTVKTTDMSTDTRVPSITAAGQFSLRVNGYINIIAQITAYTSGSITVYGRASASGTSHHTAAITNAPTTNKGAVDQTVAFKDVSASWASNVNGDSSTFTVLGYHTISATITISATATISYFISNDGVLWNSTRNVSDLGAVSNSTSTSTTIKINVSGVKFFKWTVASNTGTVSIVGQATEGIQTVVAPSVTSGTAISAATRTASTTSSDISNSNFRGVQIFLNITSASGTGGLQLAIQTKDSIISSNYKTTHTLNTAYTATGQYTLLFYPGADALSVATGAQVVSQAIASVFRVQVIHGDSSSYTYSASYSLLL